MLAGAGSSGNNEPVCKYSEHQTCQMVAQKQQPGAAKKLCHLTIFCQGNKVEIVSRAPLKYSV
jgi:hypothetical protein